MQIVNLLVHCFLVREQILFHSSFIMIIGSIIIVSKKSYSFQILLDSVIKNKLSNYSSATSKLKSVTISENVLMRLNYMLLIFILNLFNFEIFTLIFNKIWVFEPFYNQSHVTLNYVLYLLTLFH